MSIITIMDLSSVSSVNRRLDRIKKIPTYYHKTLEWHSQPITPETHPQLFAYLDQFTFTGDESENIRTYLREAIAAGDLSLSALADRDKFLHIIKEFLLQQSGDANVRLIAKVREIITPFLNNEITTFIRNDDDLVRMMSIFFFYPVYSIYPLVSSYKRPGFSGSGIGPGKMREIVRKFLKIPNENFQFSIMAYLLIDKYMDEEADPDRAFLCFCKTTFTTRVCEVDMAKTFNNDMFAFKHYYDRLVSVYPLEKYPHLYQFMEYLFNALDRSAKAQGTGKSGEEEREEERIARAQRETFSKSYLTIYFFILMSNLELKGQSVEAILESSKKAWLIQCYDDICDIHQDLKNGVETIFAFWARKGDGDGEDRKGGDSPQKLLEEITHIFHLNLLYIYETTHKESPLMCRTLVYITLHIHNFLIYKNRKFLPEGCGLFKALYTDIPLLDEFGIDLFSSTQILIPFLKKCLAIV
jgi:hypothetical protein